MDYKKGNDWILLYSEEIENTVDEPVSHFSSNPLQSKNLIVRLTFEFALEIIELTEKLEERKKYTLAKQVLRSGTSIGENVREAQHAESKADFIHKMKIAAKEAEETDYWLLLFQNSKNYPDTELLRGKLVSISRILSKIISSAKGK